MSTAEKSSTAEKLASTPKSIPAPRLVLLACLLANVLLTSAASAQLSVLSSGSTTSEWRKTQIASLQEQLAADSTTGDLRKELQAQLKWLSAWTPGSLSETPLWEAPEAASPPAAEPIIDPEGSAKDLRERLLGTDAHPTTRDTNELEKLLNEHPDDIGIRQLHLHWLDQPQYRKTYADAIADTASRVLAMFDQLEAKNEDIRLAKAYCLYRRTRALAYRELPEVVAKQPIQDPVKHEAMLLGAYNQLTELAGKERPEFVLVDVRMLRRDHFYGRALVLLTDHAGTIDAKWFLKKRRDLLTELGWAAPAAEAAKIYAKVFPDEAEEKGDTDN